MKIEFLGTAGATVTPRPGCDCQVCTEARAKGIPYSRTGPSLFIHGPNLLVDTPEESQMQLNRANLFHVPNCIYSHWHPDHVMGRRVWEMNFDWRNWPPHHRKSDIFLPQQVAADFQERLGMWDHLKYLEERGAIRLVILDDGGVVVLGDTRIHPFRLAADYVYAFLVEEGDKRVLIAPDELVGWEPPEWVQGVDLAIIPKGLYEFDPFSGNRVVPEDHPVLKTEATFRQTLEMVHQLDAKAIIMTHIEEADRHSYDDLIRLGEQLQGDGYNIHFAYDTMTITV